MKTENYFCYKSIKELQLLYEAIINYKKEV
jgi:hypothetical protein